MSEFVLPNDTLLDIGIGTGLSALPFKKAGLIVSGVDDSVEMLKIFDSKKIAPELKLCDFSFDRFPYKNTSFEHVISSGVFHLLGNLSKLFSDVSRILREGGLFGFTVDNRIDFSDNPRNVLSTGGILEYINPKSGIKTYKRSERYIVDVLIKNNLTVLKKHTFHAYKKTEWSDNIFFTAYLTRK